MNKINLLCIVGTKVYRYIAGKRDSQVCEIDFDAVTTVENLKSQLEHFRLHGLN